MDVHAVLSGACADAARAPGLGRDLLEGMDFPSSPSFEVWLTNERRHLQAASEAVLAEAAQASLAACRPDAAIETLAEHSLRLPKGASQSLIVPWGGAVARQAPAWPLARRDAAWVVHPFMLWDDPARDAEHVAWARDASAAMRPYTNGGVYLNFVGDEGDKRIRAAFGDGNLARLADVKARYDPDNVFRLNHNIRPVRAAAVRVS